MARQAPFTEYEAVLLLDAFLKTLSGAVSRKEAVQDCSAALRRMAVNNGIEIDETYRNTNGIAFQMASMESAYRGRTLLKPATRLFTETVEMFVSDRKRYEKILKEVKRMAEDKSNKEERFVKWLSKQVSPARLSELYMVFLEVEQYAKKTKMIDRSLYENIDLTLIKRIRGSIEQNKIFKFMHKKQMGKIDSALNYLVQFTQEDGASPVTTSESALTDVTAIEAEPEAYLEPVSDTALEKNTFSAEDTAKHNKDVRTVDFSVELNTRFAQAVAFSYCGERRETESWRTLYVDLCKCLLKDYPEHFEQMLDDSIKRRTRLWLVDEAHINMLAAPKLLAGGLYVEANRSASYMVKTIRWILEQCNVDSDHVKIEYIKRVDEEEQSVVSVPQSERKYIRDDKEEFYQWLLNEQHMAEATCRGYVSAIRGAEMFAKEHDLPKTRLLGTSGETAKVTADLLFANLEFVSKNENQHNRFRAAIAKLLSYYGVEWTVSEKARSVVSKVKDRPMLDMQLYGIVLERCFPRGYRLGSSIEFKKFRRHYEEINSIALTLDHGLAEGLIRQSGIEHGGRVYAPQTMINDDLKDRIFVYVERCLTEGKTALYFEAIFREFSEEFLEHNIYDANMLKTYISYMAGDRYYIGKSYLSNERRNAEDPVEDIRACLKDYGLPMKVEELCKTLSHIPSERIKTILGTNLEFVRNGKGEYFHADSLALSDEELENLSSILDMEIEIHEYISGNELYEAIINKYPYLKERNTMLSVIGWRDALKFKMGDQYSFSGNIISAKGKNLSMSDVFASFAREQGRFTLQELLAFAENMGTVVYFDALYEYAVRISYEQFIEKNAVRFQVKATDEILDRFCTGAYLAIPRIEDFGIFPEASHPWTTFLLENYLAHQSERYYLMHGGYTQNTAVGAMVKKEQAYADFDELIIDVLAESGVALQKEAALKYLSDNGYIARRSYSNMESLLISAREKRNKKEN